jgi:hypothetical protein
MDEGSRGDARVQKYGRQPQPSQCPVYVSPLGHDGADPVEPPGGPSVGGPRGHLALSALKRKLHGLGGAQGHPEVPPQPDQVLPVQGCKPFGRSFGRSIKRYEVSLGTATRRPSNSLRTS